MTGIIKRYRKIKIINLIIGEMAVSWHTIQMLKHISIHNTVYSQTKWYPHHLAGDPDFSLAHTPPGL